MNCKLKTIATAVSMALALGVATQANAAPGAKFDLNGTAGPGAANQDIFDLSGIDWNVGNIVAIQNREGTAAEGSTRLIGQSFFSSFSHGAGTTHDATLTSGNYDLTYQFAIDMTQVETGGTLTWTDRATASVNAPSATYTNYFCIYQSGSAAAKANLVTGTGYGLGTQAAAPAAGLFCPQTGSGEILVYEGTITTLLMNFVRDATNGGNSNPSLLDTYTIDGDQGNGVGSDQGGGTGSVLIETTYQNTDYFLSSIDGLTFDLTFIAGGPSLPFGTEIPPNDQVLDRNLVANLNTTYGFDTGTIDLDPLPGPPGINETLSPGQLINNFNCGVNAVADDAICDYHMRSDASTSVLVATFVPEPGSLALLGLGLGLLGMGARRKLRA